MHRAAFSSFLHGADDRRFLTRRDVVAGLQLRHFFELEGIGDVTRIGEKVAPAHDSTPSVRPRARVASAGFSLRLLRQISVAVDHNSQRSIAKRHGQRPLFDLIEHY